MASRRRANALTQIRVIFIFISFAFMWEIASSSYVKRRAGDQSQKGYCTRYYFGGVSWFHWYVCCNNCGESSTYCDGMTYQGGSNKKYCNSCGVDSRKGDGYKGASFRCGHCSGQDKVHSICYSSIRKLPGFCWLYAHCFKSHCSDMSSGKDLVPDTCYDHVCDPGESVENCPVDCCGEKNAKCAWNDTCMPECCGKSSCCLTAGTAPMATFFLLPFGTTFLLSVYIILQRV